MNEQDTASTPELDGLKKETPGMLNLPVKVYLKYVLTTALVIVFITKIPDRKL